MPEVTDSDYFDAFARGLLDPEECLARWEHHHAEATAWELALAEHARLLGLLDELPEADLDERREAAKAAVTSTNRELQAARRRLALHLRDIADNPPPVTVEQLDTCVTYRGAEYTSAAESFTALVVLVVESDLNAADEAATLEPAKLLLADCQRRRVAACQRRAVYGEYHVASVEQPPATSTPRTAPRPRGRRARRRVARTSSTSAGGGDPPPPRPARGLATCPLCTNEAIVRSGCQLCRGLGFVGREARNRYKRGER